MADNQNKKNIEHQCFDSKLVQVDSRTRYKNDEDPSVTGVFSLSEKTRTQNRTILDTKKLFVAEQFTIPRIYKGTSEWFIEFFFNDHPDTGKKERFRIRGGLNRIKDLKEREALAKEVQRKIHAQLKAGAIPNRTANLEVIDDNNLLEELELLAESEKKGKSIDTARSYTLMINRLRKFLTNIEQLEIRKNDFSFQRAQEFKDYLIEEMELSNVSVNCTIQPIKKWFTIFRKKQQIQDNPFDFVEYLPKHRGTKFIAFDDDEKKRISEHLKSKSPELYLFSNFIYSCFIRPKEICALLPSDIDLNRGFVQVRSENSKVNHTTFRQIFPGLKAIIKEMNIAAMPKNRPIFESICGTDKDLRLRRRRVSDLWGKMVISELDIDKAMYGLKHTGNIDYLKSLENVTQQNLMFLKQQNDHTTLATTQKYIEDIGIYKMNTERINFGVL